MGEFRKIRVEELAGNPFQRIGKEWMLVGAKSDGRVNMMTANWGGMGILWNKPVAFVFIRPQRYTKELVDAADTLSLTFFDQEYRHQLNLCGSKSGRDMDKVEACGFTVAYQGDTPYFTQANTALIGKKLYRQKLTPDSFLVKEIDAAMYPERDYHDLYVVEITDVLVK